MDLLEKYNGAMKHNESRKARVEKAMNSLVVEFKNLEHADSSTQRLLQDCCADIQSRQERLNTVQKSVTSSNRELGEIMKSLEERLEQVESREKGLRVMNEEVVTKMGFVDGVLERGIRDFEERERKIEGQMKLMEGVFDKFCLERREFERFKGLIEGRFEVIKLKEKDFEDRQREFGKGFVDKEEEFEVKEKSIKIREIKLDKFMVDCALKMKFVEDKEKELVIKEKSIENRKFELDRDLVQVEEKLKNVVEKEEEVKFKEKNNKKRENELDGIVDEIDLSHKNVRDKEKIIEFREIELNKAWVELDMKMKNVEKNEEIIGIHEIELNKAWVELDMEIKKVEKEEKAIEVRKRSIENEEKHLEAKKKDIEKSEIRLDRDLVEFNVKMKNVMEKENELRLKEKNFEIRNIEPDGALVDFDLMKKNVEEKKEELEVIEKSIEDHKLKFESNEVNLIKTSCEERCSKFELEKVKREEQIKELEIKTKKIGNVDHSVVKPEPWSDDGSYADIRFSVTMDGNNLLLYLINHKKNLDSMTDEVYEALGKSMEPAKLVLDAMQGFYSKKEDKKFEEDVVCRVSILLLEQLRKISPHIQSYLKKAALELASKWKDKMKSSMEVIVFLQLLASYKLESYFEPEEFLSVFEVIGQPIRMSELFQLLGYMGKISDLIQVMLKEQQHVKAVRYVCAFGLRDKFQPASLLKDFLKNAIEVSKTLCENINNPVYQKDEAIDNIVASLKEALVCILHHKLESDYSPKNIEMFIQQLVQQKEDGKVLLLASNNDADKLEAEKNCKLAKSVPNPTETCTIHPKKFGKKRRAAGSDLGPKVQTRRSSRKLRRTEPLVE